MRTPLSHTQDLCFSWHQGSECGLVVQYTGTNIYSEDESSMFLENSGTYFQQRNNLHPA